MFGKKPESSPDALLFTIFDTKSGSYRDPVLVPDLSQILRQLESNFTNPATQFDQYVTHSEDFQLFSLGSFDRKTGLISATQPQHVINLHEVKTNYLQRSRALSPT